MFVYSMRAGTLRFFAIVGIAIITLVTLIAFVPALQPVAAAEGEVATQAERINYEKIRTEEDRIAFLAQFGWEVSATPTESTTVTIPREFDKVFAAYNEIQRAQGLDLSPYSGRTVERYTYTVTNYQGYQGEVLANVLIFRGKVIGGDICAADASGFLHGFDRPTA